MAGRKIRKGDDVIVRTGKMLGIDTPANAGIVEAMKSVDARTAAPSVDVVRDI